MMMFAMCSAEYLHEKDVAGGICPSMHHKRLLLDMSASTGPDR